MDRSPIELTTNRGHRLKAFPNDSITNEIRDAGVYDHWTLVAVEQLLQQINADVCLDVGANIGNHAVVMAQHCRRLYAFEPIPFIFKVLQDNLLNNTKNAQAQCIALSDRSAVQNIHIDPAGNLGKSTMLSRTDTDTDTGGDSDNDTDASKAESIEISAVSGDQFMGDVEGSVDFIKIDVEGFEPRVIKGLQQTIIENQPIILLEWNSSQTRQGFAADNLFAKPLDGYQSYSLTHRRSKQVSGRGLKGAVKRAMVRMANSDDWCLRKFDADQSYPNVLMFPRRWQDLAAGLPQA